MPDVRSRRVATEVTRNITTNGKMPSSGAPMLVEGRRCRGRSRRAARAARTGTTSISARVRWSWRSWARTRPAVAGARRLMTGSIAAAAWRSACGRRGRGSGLDIGGRRCWSSSAAGVSSASSRPSRISSSRSQRVASSMTWLLTSSVAPLSARRAESAQRSRRSTGSRPTVGSSSTSSSGVPSSAAASETRASWPPESRPVTASTWSRSPTSSTTRSTSDRRAHRGRRRSSAGSRARSGRRRPTVPG